MAVNKSQIGAGFWLGIGLLLALLVWGFASMVLGRAVGFGGR